MADKNYKSVEQYAELCGISVQAVYSRIKSNKIESIYLQSYGMVIDVDKYPAKEKRQGRVKFSDKHLI